MDCTIRVHGRLEPRWVTWFAGMTLTTPDDGPPTLRGRRRAPAALHGVLAGRRDLGVPLLSLSTDDPTPDAEPPAPAPRQKGRP